MDEAYEARNAIREEIHEALGRYLDTWGEDYEGGHVSTYWIVAEVVYGGGRTILEFGPEHASHYTAMGLLFTSLNDPRWLDPGRES